MLLVAALPDEEYPLFVKNLLPCRRILCVVMILKDHTSDFTAQLYALIAAIVIRVLVFSASQNLIPPPFVQEVYLFHSGGVSSIVVGFYDTF